MPATFELHCTSCSHEQLLGLLRFPFAVCDDESRVILPHPGEDHTAREHTGLGISELHAANRLGFFVTCICTNCSQTFDIVPDDAVVCPDCGSADALILETAETSVGLAPCTDCENGSLALVQRGFA